MRFWVLLLSVLCCTAPVLSAIDLEHRIDALVEASGPVGRGFAGIHVVDLADGKTVYRHNDDKLFLPASNMKLFTTALALMRLGPDYRFVTQVIRDAGGDLVLVGSGDPSLSGRVFPYQKDAKSGPPLKAIEELASQIAASGVTRVDGDVVGDDRLYPWIPYAPTWAREDELRQFGAPVSALTVNENSVALIIRPGAHAGELAELKLDPAFEYYSIDNRVTTVARGTEPKIRLARPAGSGQLLLWGSIPEGRAAVVESTPVDDPALFAAAALYEALTRRGIAITGRPVARHRQAMDDLDPVVGTLVATRTSPPLTHLLQVTNKVSHNLFAELMLREVGRYARHSGTREAGIEELNAMLKEIGVSREEARLEDGSGLSQTALVTPRAFTRLLSYLYASKYKEDWISLLPVGGEDGTLRRRLCCISEGRGIHAKTGSLTRSLTLSGYADSKTRGHLAFSIMVNDFSMPQSEVRAWIDKIALALTE